MLKKYLKIKIIDLLILTLNLKLLYPSKYFATNTGKERIHLNNNSTSKYYPPK